jgi:hypothetical protein
MGRHHGSLGHAARGISTPAAPADARKAVWHGVIAEKTSAPRPSDAGDIRPLQHGQAVSARWWRWKIQGGLPTGAMMLMCSMGSRMGRQHHQFGHHVINSVRPFVGIGEPNRLPLVTGTTIRISASRIRRQRGPGPTLTLNDMVELFPRAWPIWRTPMCPVIEVIDMTGRKRRSWNAVTSGRRTRSPWQPMPKQSGRANL